MELEFFLKSLNDHELAVFTYYRLEDFLENSRAKIISEIKSRSLSKDDLKQLFSEGLPVQEGMPVCSRCHSDRLRNEEDVGYEYQGRSSTGKYQMTTVRCDICGYNPGKNHPRSFLEKLFGFYRVKGESNRMEDKEWGL